MRICGYCGTDLIWAVGEEKEARDNYGTGRSHDEFLCPRCVRLFYHIVSETFDDASE